MQMHYNETGTEVAKNTEEAKNWKQTFYDITTLYHDELKNSEKLIDNKLKYWMFPKYNKYPVKIP